MKCQLVVLALVAVEDAIPGTLNLVLVAVMGVMVGAVVQILRGYGLSVGLVILLLGLVAPVVVAGNSTEAQAGEVVTGADH